MVHLMGSKLNIPLVEWLKEHSAPVMQPKSQQHSVVYRATK